jgi:hypothetical protein
MVADSLRIYGVLALALSGCAQFTTNETERVALETAAAKAGEAYVDCIVGAADRYRGTGESAEVIADVSRKACDGPRSAYVEADTAYLKSRFMNTQPVVTKHLAELDARATTQVQARVLESKAAMPPAVAAAAVPAGIGSDGGAYLDCMRAQGERYASVKEPAEVVAEVAHSRCAGALSDRSRAAELERQGRALVMGMVLDRKAGP